MLVAGKCSRADPHRAFAETLHENAFGICSFSCNSENATIHGNAPEWALKYIHSTVNIPELTAVCRLSAKLLAF